MDEKKLIRTIVDRDDGKVVGYACANCRSFYSAFTSEETACQEAERCCNPNPLCRVCSKVPTAPWRTMCKACEQAGAADWAAREQVRERAKFEAAEKIPLAEYIGEFLYFEGSGIGNEGYLPVDCLDDEFEKSARPEYARACEEFGLSIDARGIVEWALEGHHEEAGADIGPEDYKELQKLLDAWCEKQSVVSYHATNVVVVLPPQEEEE
ncbi:hypothetical protein KJ909_03955 [Patescibacteria group bacterium]|nr:hypothetical protein [Patescibacteria group bacterium]